MTNETNNLKLEQDEGDCREEPFDPKLEALLNEALAPEAIEGGIPHDLASRVFNATKDKLHRRRTILGRIGPGSWSAMAASWIITAGLAVTLATAAPPVQAALSALKSDLKALSNYKGPNDTVDQDIAGLAMQIDLTNVSTESSTASDPDVNLNFASDVSDASMIF